MRTKKILLALCLIFSFMSCSDKDENVDPIEGPNVEAEKQIEEVLSVLKEDKDLSSFREALNKIDTKELNAKEFTILAYKNNLAKRMTKATVEDSLKNETMRHMIAGRYTLEQLKELKKTIALSKDTLYITHEGDKLYINGIQLGKSITADKSIVFVMDEVIPIVKDTVPVVEDKYEFKVLNINTNWSVGQAEYSGVVDGANVFVYDAVDSTLVKELKTNAEGIVSFMYKEDSDLYIKVSKENTHHTYKGYPVAGLFTTQEDINNSVLNKVFPSIVGGLRFMDHNGDGQITEDDKAEYITLSNMTKEVAIVADTYKFPQDLVPPTREQAIQAGENAYNTYFSLDKDSKYLTLAGRKTATPNDSALTKLWRESYDAIEKANYLLMGGGSEVDTKLMSIRSATYTKLSIVFGDVPLQTGYPLDYTKAKSTVAEVTDFAEMGLQVVLQNTPDSLKYNVQYDMAILYRNAHKYQESLQMLKQIKDEGVIFLPSSPSNLVKHIWLLTAEMAVETGNTMEATMSINELYNAMALPLPLQPGATTDAIRTLVRKDLKAIDSNMKLLNMRQWDNVASWGAQSILPIPTKALEQYNGNLLQNPGW